MRTKRNFSIKINSNRGLIKFAERNYKILLHFMIIHVILI